MVHITLKREVSLPILILYGLGNILGAGIYVLVGKVAGVAGASTPLAFVIAMIVAGLTAFSYMELSSRFPKSAGTALYTFRAFGRRGVSTAIGLGLVLAGIASSATLAHGFAGYLSSVLNVPELLAAIMVTCLLTAVVLKGVGESTKVAALFTLVEVAGLLLIIILGTTGGNTVSLPGSFSLDPAVGMGGLLAGSFLAFFAFIGFEDMVNIAEEAKRPHRSMPVAILLSLVVSTLLYLLVVIVSISVASPSELSSSDAPLSLVLSRISELDPRVMSFIGMAAALNGIIVQVIMGSRMLYGMAGQGWVSRVFTKVSTKARTPYVSTLVVAAAIILATIFLPLVSLAKATSFLVLVVFALVNVSLIVIKKQSPSPASNSIKVPVIIPVLGALSTFAVVVYQAAEFFV